MGVMHVENIRAYIHCKKELVGLDRLRAHMETMMKLDKTFMDKYAQWSNHPIGEYAMTYEFYESEWIKILLSRIHDDLFWIGEVPIRITGDLINEMTCLSRIDTILLVGKDVRKIVEQTCKSRSDRRGMTIKPIEKDDITLMSMILGYMF